MKRATQGVTASRRRGHKAPTSRRQPPRSSAGLRPRVAGAASAAEVERIRKQIQQVAGAKPPRWNADPEDVRRSVLKLVLTLVELVRQLLERQAIRRMESGTLSTDETESVGRALMQLQATIADLAKQFDIAPEELNLDLGPLGKLL